MRLLQRSPLLYLLTSFSLLSTPILAMENAPSTTASSTTFPIPTPPIEQRAVVDAPAEALPSKPTQVSPVMTIEVDGAAVLYTQKFSAVPDQWPKPSKGTIGFGTLDDNVKQTKAAEKRSEPTDPSFSSLLKLRCRTLECRKQLLEEGVYPS